MMSSQHLFEKRGFTGQS